MTLWIGHKAIKIILIDKRQHLCDHALSPLLQIIYIITIPDNNYQIR